MRRRSLLLPAAVLAALAATGCVSIGSADSAPAHVYLQLTDPGDSAPRATPLTSALLIQPDGGDALADTQSIAYARAPGRYAFYQLASWTERPVRRLPLLLQQRLQRRGVAAAVGQVGDPLSANWLLTLRIDAMYHDATVEPNRARVALTLALYDRRQRLRVAQRSFVSDVDLASSDAPAAASALSQSVAQVFDQVVPWLEAALTAAATTVPAPAPSASAAGG